MTERDKSLQEIRPVLDLVPDDYSPAQRFQNTTLRPILKWQHPIVVTLFFAHLGKNHKTFVNLPQIERHALVSTLIRSDAQLRNQLIGLVIGLFTEAELGEYLGDVPELKRRIISLAIQRIQSVT